MELARVRNESVWRSLRIIFIASGLLFLVNIYFGFSNALTTGDIERQQILIHLHAGSVGWITLSAIGVGIWLVTGSREVSDAYARGVRRLAIAAVAIFALYIPNFWLAFMGEGSITVLLPILGSLAVLTLWTASIFTISQLRHQPLLTTVQLLAAGALLVAAIGATVGALLGLERAIGQFLPLPDEDRTAAHAGTMDTYLFLLAAAIVEWVVRPAQRWSWPGLVQAAAWTVGATMVPIAFLLGAQELLLPIYLVLLLLGTAIFLVRVAWRAVLNGPLAEGLKPWAFFGTAWLVTFMGIFLMAITAADFNDLPAWFGTAFVHVGFVGMMTNLVLAVHSARGSAARHLLGWAEPTAMWLLNLGIIAFLALEVIAEVRTGAFVMGIGVLLGVLTMIARIWTSGSAADETRTQPAAVQG